MATLEGHPPHLQTTLAIGIQSSVATIATPLSGHGKVLFFLKKKEFGKKIFSTYLVSLSSTRVNRSFHSSKTIIWVEWFDRLTRVLKYSLLANLVSHLAELKRLLTIRGRRLICNTWHLLINTKPQYAYWRTRVRLGTYWSAPVKYWERCRETDQSYQLRCFS